MTKPRFVNVVVRRDALTGAPYCMTPLVHFGSRLDADCAAVGFSKATCCEPHAGRHLRAAGVAFRVKVTMKEGRA